MSISRRSLLAAAAAPVLSCRKQRSFSAYAFVANKRGRAVAVVDLGALAVVKHIPLPAEPSQILTHPSLRSVFTLTPAGGSIHEIDAETLTLRRTVAVHDEILAAHLALRPSAGESAIWGLTARNPRLIRVSLDSLRREAEIRLPETPVAFDVSPWEPVAAVSFGTSGRAGIVDLAERKVRSISRIGEEAGRIRFRSDGRHILAANPAERRLCILDTKTGQTITQLLLALRPENFCFSRDGGQLFLTGEGMDAVVVVYPYRTEVAQTRLAGRAPGAMATSATPPYLFVANPRSGDVTIIDIETQRVVAVTAVGAQPSFIAITPNSEYALVLNHESGDMAVIRVGAITPNRRRFAPLLTMIPVGSGPVEAVVRAI